jgi:hypothetical protein
MTQTLYAHMNKRNKKKKRKGIKLSQVDIAVYKVTAYLFSVGNI